MESKIIELPNGYKAVLVPKEANSIYTLEHKLNYYNGEWQTLMLYKPEYKGKTLELIGILHETLTEEQAREIVGKDWYASSGSGRWYKDYAYTKEDFDNNVEPKQLTALESLQSLIESKGGKLKNPYGEEPNQNDYDRYPLPICFAPYAERQALFGRKQRIERDWESSERELQKAIIIKSKKQ